MHQLIFWILFLTSTATSEDLYIFGQDAMIDEERWADRNIANISFYAKDHTCLTLRPTNKDIINRFTSVLPYFERSDRERDKVLFLDKIRHTLIAMANSNDAMDREIAYFATVLIPLVFLQEYKDMWCLLERFYRAIRLFSLSHPSNKKSGLKLLQNLRSVNQKVKMFVTDLPYHEVSNMPSGSFSTDSPAHKKDIKYLKELFKSLG